MTQTEERAARIIELCDAIGNEVADQMQANQGKLADLDRILELYNSLFALVAPSDPDAPETRPQLIEDWSRSASRAVQDLYEQASFVGANVGARLSLVVLAYWAFVLALPLTRQLIDRKGRPADIVLLLDEISPAQKKALMVSRGELKVWLMTFVGAQLDEYLKEIELPLRKPGPLPDLKKREQRRLELMHDMEEAIARRGGRFEKYEIAMDLGFGQSKDGSGQDPFSAARVLYDRMKELGVEWNDLNTGP
jgi:hypothetical protein